MEWILATKSLDETTNDDFSDLLKQKFTQRSSTGGFNLIAAYNARTTGFANVNLDREVEVSIDSN
jgi:hypothetical protein